MLTEQENVTLTRTGPATPMGKTFRQYWMPALLSRELPAPDCPPKRMRLLGEDFIAFRDTEGTVGIVEPRCPHRGANLFFGRNADCGLRCAYHGWKFNTQGECTDIPIVDAQVAEQLRPKASIRALEVREWGDMIWAYLGDGAAPGLPQFEFATMPPEHRFVSKKFQQCNYAQAAEGGIDTAHFSFLHAGIHDGEPASLLYGVRGATVPTPGENEPSGPASFRWMAADPTPQFSIVEHDGGFMIGAARKTDDDDLYWRFTQFLMPNHSLAPGSLPGQTIFANTWVLVDDTSCWIYCYAWNPDRPLTEAERSSFGAGAAIFAEVDDEYMPVRKRENDYLIDRQWQQEASFTGIDGISEQDQAIADSQGVIADRTHELLGQTDLAVVRFRRMMLNAAKVVAAGERPLGVDSPDAYAIRSGATVVPPGPTLEALAKAHFADKWGVRSDAGIAAAD